MDAQQPLSRSGSGVRCLLCQHEACYLAAVPDVLPHLPKGGRVCLHMPDEQCLALPGLAACQVRVACRVCRVALMLKCSLAVLLLVACDLLAVFCQLCFALRCSAVGGSKCHPTHAQFIRCQRHAALLTQSPSSARQLPCSAEGPAL
jgi:hypothetical protein